MIVIEFIATCRPHDLQERVQMRGKDTPRQLTEGYTELDRKMRQLGCDDYSSVHSATKWPNDKRIPHLFVPSYPALDPRIVDRVNANVQPEGNVY